MTAGLSAIRTFRPGVPKLPVAGHTSTTSLSISRLERSRFAADACAWAGLAPRGEVNSALVPSSPVCAPDIDHYDSDVVGLCSGVPVRGPRKHLVEQLLSKLLGRKILVCHYELSQPGFSERLVL
jgi:hypothetical protein